jgi:hypothetical protein
LRTCCAPPIEASGQWSFWARSGRSSRWARPPAPLSPTPFHAHIRPYTLPCTLSPIHTCCVRRWSFSARSGRSRRRDYLPYSLTLPRTPSRSRPRSPTFALDTLPHIHTHSRARARKHPRTHSRTHAHTLPHPPTTPSHLHANPGFAPRPHSHPFHSHHQAFEPFSTLFYSLPSSSTSSSGRSPIHTIPFAPFPFTRSGPRAVSRAL